MALESLLFAMRSVLLTKINKMRLKKPLKMFLIAANYSLDNIKKNSFVIEFQHFRVFQDSREISWKLKSLENVTEMKYFTLIL